MIFGIVLPFPHCSVLSRHLFNCASAILRFSPSGKAVEIVSVDAVIFSRIIGKGEVFDYFDGLRKVIEPARKEVFFIDRYLNAEFVSKYLPLVHADAIVRLLTTEKCVPQLVPAIDAFCKQNALKVEIRTTNEVHDRHLIIDRAECYQSGASFKDGAKFSPTTLTQITDAFDAVRQTYESIWAKAVVVR